MSNGHKDLIIWGGTGQCKIVNDIARDYNIVAVFDDSDPLPPNPIKNSELHHSSFLKGWLNNNKPSYFVVAIGNPNSKARIEISKRLITLGLQPIMVQHSTSVSLTDLTVQAIGVQISALAHIGVDVQIGNYCIINSLANVEHDCVLGDGVEIGPSATLCGSITIGDHSWIGANSVVRQFLTIGKNSIIGAGSVVVKDVPDNVVVVGNPARVIRTNT